MSDTMRCEHIQDRLDEYVDGELAEPERAAVERHIAGCDRCRAELGAIRQTVRLVKSLPRENAPGSLWPGVQRRLASQAASRRRSTMARWLGVGAWAAAAATLLLVIKFAPWQRQSPVSQPGRVTIQEERSAAGKREADRDTAAEREKPQPAARAAKKVEKPREAPDSVPEADRAEAAPTPATEREKRATAAPQATLENDTKLRRHARGRTMAAESARAPAGAAPGVRKMRDQGEANAFEAAKAPAPRFTYKCEDLDAGLKTLRKALAKHGGAIADDKLDKRPRAGEPDNTVVAHLPPGRLPALIRELKLVTPTVTQDKLEESALDAAAKEPELGSAAKGGGRGGGGEGRGTVTVRITLEVQEKEE